MDRSDMINVLVVDDSLPVRKAFEILFGRTSDINLLGAAEDPIDAISHLKQSWPDVIVLDIEMPKIDGLTFLEKIMREKPTPIIICSSKTNTENSLVQKAFSLGAAAVMGKPSISASADFLNSADDIIATVRSLKNIDAAKLVLSNISSEPNTVKTSKPTPSGARTAHTTSSTTPLNYQLIAIGSSTGGPQALELIIPKLSTNMPPIVIVQHMPSGFTHMLAQRLNSLCECDVFEAKNGMELSPGMVAIAPGGAHTEVVQLSNGRLATRVSDGPLVNRHKPSVDILFRSINENVTPQKCLAIILTGMGRDGASEMKQLFDAGATTIAQDKASSVVWGMPGEVVALGGAKFILEINSIAQNITSIITGKK